MSSYDLLFLALVAAAAGSLITAGVCALSGNPARAAAILHKLLLGGVAYLLTVVLVSFVPPRRIVQVGENQCFDDWCIAVTGVHRVPGGQTAAWQINLRLSSRARRITQRENNLAVYLTDGRGARYNPVASPVPLNTALGPGESLDVPESFLLPAEAKDVGAVITHEGGFPIGWFIIGYPTWFRRPPLVRLE